MDETLGVSLVAQWWRIRLPMQETWVWYLICEDPTCSGDTNPMCHNYWPWAPEPVSHSYWNPHDLQPSSTQEQPAVRSLGSAIGESLPPVTMRGSPQQQGPTIAKSKWIKLSKNLKIEWDTCINYRWTIKTSESNVMLIWLENRVI